MKYPTYSEFGGKTAQDIFGKSLLNQAVRKKVVLLESCIFLNNGNGTFTINKLPRMAQFAPVRDILADDFTRDWQTDLLLVGNHYAVRPSLGRYDASYGWCLAGSTDHQYTALKPVNSGFIVRGDARRLIRLKISGEEFIVAAVNDGDLQVFQPRKHR
jgi:hypothetical protein